jgi:nucleoside-diphosphate-sugar epimerase
MKALVTGASGFIGRCVADRLRDEGWEVTGLGRGVKPASFAGIWHSCDLSTSAPNQVAVDVDLVVHCAGQAHSSGLPAEEFQRHVVTSSTNLLTSMTFSSARGGRLIYLSSIKAMGECLPKGSNERMVPSPASPYGKAKLTVEGIFERAVKDGTLQSCTVLRPSPVFGEGSKGLIGLLARLGQRGLVPPVSGNTGYRSYVHVADVASAVLSCDSLDSFHTFCLSDGGSYQFGDVRAALNAQKPWSKFVPGLNRPVRAALGLSVFERRLRLEERLFADCHVSSSELTLKTGWTPNHKLADWLRNGEG